jgi:hypothetical protein
MCPPWLDGAHAGAPLQDSGISYFYERNLYDYAEAQPQLWRENSRGAKFLKKMVGAGKTSLVTVRRLP